MAQTQTLGEIIKLGDLPMEEKEQILDTIIYSAEHEGEMYNDVNKQRLDANRTSLTFMRSYLPEIDKGSERYKNGLLEGVTPSPESINEAEFTVPVKQNGWYYRFTDKAIEHAFTDIKGRCEKFLGNLFKTYHDEKIADAFLTTANVVTTPDLLDMGDLLKIHDTLYVNGAQPFDGGFYILRVAPEVASKMLVTYASYFTHTTQKENIVIGEIGELAGFRIVKSRLQAFKGRENASDSSKNDFPFVAYGKTMKGEYPVTIVAYDELSSSIIFKKPGDLGDDPLNQRGSIGLKLDGHGFYVYDDAVAVRGVYTVAKTSLGVVSKLNDANRSNLAASAVARAITPEYDFVKINKYSAGTTANTLVIKAHKPDGSEWAFAASGTGKAKVVSGNTSVATVAFSSGVCTLTAVAPGFTTLAISDNDNANQVTVMTVQVLDGVGAGVIA